MLDNPEVEFKSKEDIWEYIERLSDEIEEVKNQTGREFPSVLSIYKQIPFFACNNNILNNQSQLDISKFIYCVDTGVPVYGGDYGEQPQIWISKYFAIKSAMEVRTKLYNQTEKKNG